MSNDDKLDELWNQAHDTPGVPVEIGRIVVCDACDRDYTDRPDSGGLIFALCAICPECEPHALIEIIDCEMRAWIRAYCPAGVSFSDFVRQQRGTNNTILVDRIQ